MLNFFAIITLLLFIINAEQPLNKQRSVQLELIQTKLRLIEEDEELLQLHRKILKLHKLLEEKLAKKNEVIAILQKIKLFKE